MRAFFARHGINWDDFRSNGVSASTLEATGDAMAIAVAKLARDESGKGEL